MRKEQQDLYDSRFEHDNCGIGFVANLKNKKSNQIIQDALRMLERMEHRGAVGAEPNSGDGAGILIQKPHKLYLSKAIELGFSLPKFENYGVAQVFFPSDKRQAACKDILEKAIAKFNYKILGYRVLPKNNTVLGFTSGSCEPDITQVFIERPSNVTLETFERQLFVIRNYTSHQVVEQVENTEDDFYIATCSYKTIAYKGQFTTEQVGQYFHDLNDPDCETALAVVHSRFSTNTFPKWKLAQPFRYIAHNGEINTVRGNVNWFKSREAIFKSTKFTKEELDMVMPVCNHSQSDSANLDNAVEMLALSGRSLPHVMMMVMPEAWQENPDMELHKKAFYQYHANIMEPWDGPASVSFTDGKIVGATLDRNGLRPSRYLVTEDDKLIMASETGVLKTDPAKVIKRGRLQPGKIFVADLEQGRIITDDEVKDGICKEFPYEEWVKEQSYIDELPSTDVAPISLDSSALLDLQQAFGYTSEDLKFVIAALADDGKEPLSAMGVDIPLPVLSEQTQHIACYFKQIFAQVTNPPIDPIRERMVMSLMSFIGEDFNLLEAHPKAAKKIRLEQPILTNSQLAKLEHIKEAGYKSSKIDILFDKQEDLQTALSRIASQAIKAVKEGNNILILSNKQVSANRVAIPSLLATGTIHHALIKAAVRARVDLVIEAGDVFETHHVATLIGYGAAAVNPFLGFETIKGLQKAKLVSTELTYERLEENYIRGIGAGLLKIFSKMGISTLQSYQGAQIFEALGIDNDVIDFAFTGTASRIRGVNFDDLKEEALIKHNMAFPEVATEKTNKLEVGGVYQWKRRGEFHLFNPNSISFLQRSTKNDDYATYKKYAREINDQTKKAATLRGLLEFTGQQPISLAEVEPVENIYKRFATGAMSFGSISHEAHSTLAIAMNRIGGKSNSGEGGEDPSRFEKKENGDWERSAIKQVASGRFGVTSYYLTNADEIQIKMAQGAKPGEGGQLPGHKVDDWIGATRHSTPGVGLISPPPHHDIYSIEDLAQLISDLKNANRAARINVKLVSEAGVGTIASGVCKAHADVVLIAGHDGGTGASPVSSIRHAGGPWELGLAETHQTLVKNRLRDRITVQADGQMKTGRDLAIATLLGAEEWGVATAALVVEGCIMMRKCHLNTCPVGIATQNKDLRARYTGKPDHVVNFFKFLANELREIMAELGFRTIDEMVGRVDKLKMREHRSHWKQENLDLSLILAQPEIREGQKIIKTQEQDHALEEQIDWKFLELAEPALENQTKVEGSFEIENINRSTGTLLSNEISKKYKGEGLPEDTISIHLKGSAGQSFGAFSAAGLTLNLEGEANDYFGKGLSGAKLILTPHNETKYDPKENIIVGNVAFYGATSGEAYMRGIAGERFCVRNSGAKAVVEGIGDHGCEYMTGGVALILGETGRNFAAGMSGGVAYIYDTRKTFKAHCNMEMVEFDLIEEEDRAALKYLITRHKEYTGSDLAEEILEDFESALLHFVKVMPTDYKRVLEERKKEQITFKEEVING